MSLSDIGIKARLYSGFGALVLACAGIAGFATYQQSAIQGQVTKLGLIGENTARVLQISADLQALRRANLRYIYDADEASYIEAGERETSATRLLVEAAKTTVIEERRKVYSEVEANVGHLRAGRDELGVIVKKLTTGKALLLTEGDRLAAEAAKLVETYRISSRDPIILQAAEDFETSLLKVQVENWRFLATRDAAGIARFKSSLDQARLQAEKLQKFVLSEPISTALDSINGRLLEFGTAFDTTSSSVLRSDEIWSKELRAISSRNTAALAKAESALKQDFAAVKERSDEMVASTTMLQEIIAGLSLALGGILAFFVARAILRPIQGMTEAMTKLAGGDVRIEVPALDNKDEIGGMAKAVVVFQKAAIEKLRLEQEAVVERERNEVAQRRAQEEAIAGERELVSNSIGAGLAKLAAKEVTFRLTDALPEAYRSLQNDFNNALEQIEAALRNLSASTETINAGTQELSAASDDLSRRTEQQASSLEETAAALNEITETVRKTAEGAREARDVVAMARTDAEQGGVVVERAIEAMGKIEKSSLEVTQIIGVIDEIAFQTNLLALNAGVEAARAGDAGRGFAVVASEVRTLAQRSAEAAKQIKDLISNSNTEVSQGVKLVAQTGDSLRGIVAKVGNINGVVATIASTAQEQAIGLQQVNSAVTQMDQVTQQNAAMAEEATAASKSLAQESDRLAEQVAQFQFGARAKVYSRRAEPVNVMPHAFGKTSDKAPRPAKARGKRVGGGGAHSRAGAVNDEWAEF